MSNIQVDLNDEIIDFVNSEKLDLKIDLKEAINNIVKFVLEEENLNFENVFISIDCTDADNIRKINKEYRGIDKKTDVLSFPIFEKEELRNLSDVEDEDKKIKEVELGDIILCLDVVKEHSIEYQTGLLREVLYMITHGVCHLVGHDHIIESDKVKMRAVEEKVLSKIGVK